MSDDQDLRNWRVDPPLGWPSFNGVFRFRCIFTSLVHAEPCRRGGLNFNWSRMRSSFRSALVKPLWRHPHSRGVYGSILRMSERRTRFPVTAAQGILQPGAGLSSDCEISTDTMVLFLGSCKPTCLFPK